MGFSRQEYWSGVPLPSQSQLCSDLERWDGRGGVGDPRGRGLIQHGKATIPQYIRKKKIGTLFPCYFLPFNFMISKEEKRVGGCSN